MSTTSPPSQAENSPAAIAGLIYGEILRVMGLRGKPWALPPVRFFFGAPVRRISQVLYEFDRQVALQGWHSAAQSLSSVFLRGVESSGEQHIPTSGPLLLVCNHPGSYDVIALAAAIPRDDLQVISSTLSFLGNLPAVSPHFLTITPDDHRRMAVVRQSIQHLKDGGALLIFPRGQVEPDPAVYPGSQPIFELWSPSLELIVRKVPETRVVAAIAGGVLSKRWVEHPFLRLWRMPEQRQKVAEVFQVSQFLISSRPPEVCPRLVFSAPFGFSAARAPAGPKGAILQAIIACASHVHAQWLAQQYSEPKGSASS